MKIFAGFVGFIALVLTGFMLLTAGWERPPVVTEQSGYRGTGMLEVINPRVDPVALKAQLDQVPESTPLGPDAGPRARDVYQNVQVLGDLSVVRFNRVMQSMTNWLYPEEGCAGCHNLNNLAEDSVYTKLVSRRMVQMTRTINSEWDSHVGATGVTCYTCHRGKNVPQYTWFNADENPGSGMLGWSGNGQNRANEQVGLTSMDADPFTDLIEDTGKIRVGGKTVLPQSDVASSSIQDTEKTYSLMMHMSTALDVNCTYCHNSRNFGTWTSSTPQRVTAWHGINMAQALNTEYVAPLSSVLPEHRLGPTGEGQKINCQTCHQGVAKPLGGLEMAKNYPSLQGEAGSAEASIAEQDAEALAILESLDNGQSSAAGDG